MAVVMPDADTWKHAHLDRRGRLSGSTCGGSTWKSCSAIVEVMLHSCIASLELSSADANTFVAEQARPGSLRLLGELDAAGVPEVWARLVGVDGDVELDCAGLTFIDAVRSATVRRRSGRLSRLEVRGCRS